MKENNLCIVIKKKAKQGAKWLPVKEVGSDLKKAILLAMDIHAFQVGVLAKSDNGSLIYWTSNHPKLFNSPVLSQVIYLGGQY